MNFARGWTGNVKALYPLLRRWVKEAKTQPRFRQAALGLLDGETPEETEAKMGVSHRTAIWYRYRGGQLIRRVLSEHEDEARAHGVVRLTPDCIEGPMYIGGLADLLRVHPQTIRNWIGSVQFGDLPPHLQPVKEMGRTLGGYRWKWSAEAARAWVKTYLQMIEQED